MLSGASTLVSFRMEQLGRVLTVLVPRRRAGCAPGAVVLERRAGRGSAVRPPASCLLLPWAASSLLLSTQQEHKLTEGQRDGAHSGQGHRLCCPSTRLQPPVRCQPCGCRPSYPVSEPQPFHLWGTVLPRRLAVTSGVWLLVATVPVVPEAVSTSQEQVLC